MPSPSKSRLFVARPAISFALPLAWRPAPSARSLMLLFINFSFCQTVALHRGRALPELRRLAHVTRTQQFSFADSGRRLSAASGREAIVRREPQVFVAACK